nr:hypothetical protein [Tanacetum cinerariifolium]
MFGQLLPCSAYGESFPQDLEPELDNESEDRMVEMDAKREGEPTIFATFASEWGITIWDPEIKSAFQDNTLRARWFRRSEECYALSLG